MKWMSLLKTDRVDNFFDVLSDEVENPQKNVKLAVVGVDAWYACTFGMNLRTIHV